MNEYYVYCLVNPVTDKVFYVGKGKSNRLYEHEMKVKNNKIPNNNKHLFHTIKNILASGNSIIYRIVEDKLTEEAAFQLEKSMIESTGIDNLCNLHTGGSGGKMTGEAELRRRKSLVGHTLSDESKQKISIANKGRLSKYKGLSRTDDVKKKISESLYGKTHSDETKKKMSLSKKGKSKSEEHKKKLRENLNNIRPKKGQVKWSDDAKKKHSERIKRWHAERREKNSVQSH